MISISNKIIDLNIICVIVYVFKLVDDFLVNSLVKVKVINLKDNKRKKIWKVILFVFIIWL